MSYRPSLFRVELGETDDKGALQTAKATGYDGEELVGAHAIRQHGLASHAPKGSHGFGLAGSGERSLVALIGLEHQDKRPRDLAEGNTVLYDAKGNATRMLGDDGVWHDAGSRPQKMTGKTILLDGTDSVTVKVGSVLIVIEGGKVYLGGKDGAQRVMTEGGPSSIVYAKV